MRKRKRKRERDGVRLMYEKEGTSGAEIPCKARLIHEKDGTGGTEIPLRGYFHIFCVHSQADRFFFFVVFE